MSYAIMTTKYELFFYNTDFHNLVWKILKLPFSKSQIEQQLNRGRNNVVTGYPGFDPFCFRKI
jgi:hypothetical protein